jgi:glycosyl transferase family 9 (putative heptosyltransferase)
MQMTGQATSHLGSGSPAPRAAILNGFGRTLGDGIIGLQALHLAIRLGAIAPRPTLFRLGHLPSMVQSLYDVADFATIRTLPPSHAAPAVNFEGAEDFDHVIDIRDFAFDPDFQRTSMVDFFLRRLGVDPHIVPACLRRNSWLARRVAPLPPHRSEGYVLVCPSSSMPLRDMPVEIHECILRHVAAIAPVVTQGCVPSALEGKVAHASPCATLTELCALVRNARWVISTDTGMVHLADAFDVPCLAFFPTHRPEWRVRDYPRCVPIALRSALPQGIEFARSASDHTLARRAWFPEGADLGWLRRAIAGCLAYL